MGLFDRFTKPTKPKQPTIRVIDDPEMLSGIRSTAMVASERLERAIGFDFSRFDEYFAAVRAEWDAQPQQEPYPHEWLTTLGFYVGELMIHMADLQWAEINDAFGSSLGLTAADEDDSRVLTVFPVDALAKRWSGESDSSPLRYLTQSLTMLCGRQVGVEELNAGARTLAEMWDESVENKVHLVFEAFTQDLQQQAEQLDMSQPVEQVHALSFATQQDIMAAVEKLGFPGEWDLVMADAPVDAGDGRQVWVVEFCRSDLVIQWDQLYAAGVHLTATTGGEYVGVALRKPA